MFTIVCEEYATVTGADEERTEVEVGEETLRCCQSSENIIHENYYVTSSST